MAKVNSASGVERIPRTTGAAGLALFLAASVLVVQWLSILERVAQLLWLQWKFFPEVESVTAGASALLLFLLASVFGTGAAVYVSLQTLLPRWARHLGCMIALATAFGAVLWLLLILSPLVELVRR